MAAFEARWARGQAILRAHELDAVWVSSPANVRYLSGFDTAFWESPTRPWFVVLPADGAPIAVAPEIGAPAFAAGPLQDIRTWPAPRPDDDGVSLLAATLEDAPRRFGRVGAELGREMSLRMPVTDFLALRDRLAGVAVVDGAPALWEMRRLKAEDEIDRIRRACRIASRGYAAVPDLVALGDSERAAARALKQRFLAEGADAVPFLPAISGPGGVSQIIAGPGERRIAPGDVLFFDTGVVFDGYFCDFDRNYAADMVDDACRRAHDAVWRATEAGIAAARPGARTDDLFAAMTAVLQDAGLLEAGGAGGNVGRLGHGLGLQLTEPPSHRPGDGTVLEPGMVLTIEPGVEYRPGKMMVHEENIVVRDGAAELLTERAPREMPILS